MNRNIDSRTRATVFSFREQVASVGEMGGEPPLGWLGNRFGVASAIVASAVLYVPAISVYLCASHLHDHVAGERIPTEEAPPAEVA